MKFSFGRFLILFGGVFYLGTELEAAIVSRLCYSALSEVGGTSQPRKIETLDDLLRAFSEGLVPDLNRKSHRAAFDIYRQMRFGQSTDYVQAETVATVAKFLKAHPDLEKAPLSPVRVDAVEKIYPVTPELEGLLKKQRDVASQIISNLYQIEANLGFWRTALDYQDPVQISKVPELKKEANAQEREDWKQKKTSLKEEIRKQKEESDQKFKDYLRSMGILWTAPPDTIESPRDIAKRRFEAMKKIREHMMAEQKDSHILSQAMVDLVHTIGWLDKSLVKILKEGDGIERLTAFRRMITDRDNFAYEIGYQGHFAEVLKQLNIQNPTGISVFEVRLPGEKPKLLSFDERLSEIEQKVVDGAVVRPGEGKARWVRPLSLVEAPIRSCLGLDCSSRTWMNTALNPNYQFFTWTDLDGASSGQISLTLGEVEQNGQKVKVAFVNKIQNIEPADLPFFIEGVRRSLEVDGYSLDIPEDLGERIEGSGGISNSTALFDAIRRIGKSSELHLHFKPHSHSQNYDYTKHSYDRSNLGLSMRAVSPLSSNEGIQFTVEPKRIPYRLDHDIDLTRLVQASYRLKDGSLEDKLRYIPSMVAIAKANLPGDPDFAATLNGWVKNLAEDMKLRKSVLLYLWKEGDVLDKLLTLFSPSDRATILQNLYDTPRYKKLLLEDRKKLLPLALLVRSSKKIRNMLISEWDRRYREAYEKVLDAADISDQKAGDILQRMKSTMKSVEPEKLVLLLQDVDGTSLAEWLSHEIQISLVENLVSPPVLSRFLSAALSSRASTANVFAKDLIKSEDPRLKNFLVLKVYREILRRMQESGTNFEEASKNWMKDPTVDRQLKAELLLAQDSPWSKNFTLLQHTLAREEWDEVSKTLDRRSTIRLYQSLANERKISADDLAAAKMETFLLSDAGISKEGIKFIMGSPSTEANRSSDENQVEVTLTKPILVAATPLTQLQWFLLKGTNPSKYKGDGEDKTITIGGEKIDLNRPMENISHDETIEFISALQKENKKLGILFKPRLPTSAEWEYFTRMGTITAYYHGDDPAELEDYAWFEKNSNSRTHPIGLKRPNRIGLFDTLGNVWEWQSDWWADRNEAGIDPQGPKAGSSRRIRGGSWFSNARDLRSAYRSYDGPGARGGNLGFRLVMDVP